MFRDEDLEVDLEATRQHVRFLIEGGINESTGALLAVGQPASFGFPHLGLLRQKVGQPVFPLGE